MTCLSCRFENRPLHEVSCQRKSGEKEDPLGSLPRLVLT